MNLHEKKKIVLVGPISYVGGVSIHMLRLEYILKNDFSIYYIDDSPKNISTNNFINIRDYKDFLKMLNLIYSSDLIHIHSGSWIIRLYVLFLVIIYKKKFIITLHSYRLSKFKSLITSFFLKKAKSILAVSVEIEKLLPKELQKKTIVKEAFLPPYLENEVNLDEDVMGIINKYNKNSTLICANAYRLIKYKGSELYGLNQCIEVARYAKTNKEKVHIIFVVATIKEEDKVYYNYFNTLIQVNNLNTHITIIGKSISFINLIKACDIVLRPTLSDGDALTIREALWFKKNVIASDIVKRPEGTILYRTGDAEDLYSKIINLKSDNSQEKIDKQVNNSNINYKFYKKLYSKCSN